MTRDGVPLRAVIDAIESAYPPELAETWDAVGLVCGDPDETVRNVLVCVDPDQACVDEAVEVDAQLILAHHPLLLRGVHGVPADQPKGRLVHRMVRAGIGLYCAHTSADSADPGVSDALAAAIGIDVDRPLVPRPDGESRTGLGRIGYLSAPERFADFADRVAHALPETSWGIRAAGDPDRPIRTVAVCGGAGDSALDNAISAGVDAYVTSDLRHHPAAEHLARGGVSEQVVPALVDVAHWASEWPWCEQAAEIVRRAVGGSVEVRVSMRRSDPWNMHVRSAST